MYLSLVNYVISEETIDNSEVAEQLCILSIEFGGLISHNISFS